MTETPDSDILPGLPPELEKLSPDARSAAARAAVPDLHVFFDRGAPLERRDAPPRSRDLAVALLAALRALPDPGARPALEARIVTDAALRGESDRDQNVYLGPLFTRTLTRAVPDLIFQPASLEETAEALRWARVARVPVTLRGAGSTAMGGSVPNDGGLTLDFARLDGIDFEASSRVCVVGAGARMRELHRRLAERDLALKVYPSNLGGTLAGWFATGGIGMNAFGHGRALDSVLAADLLLPSGEHVRFHADGRLDVPDETAPGVRAAGSARARRKTLPSYSTAEWFVLHGYEPMTLADLAGSEGALGAILQLAVAVEPRPEIGAFLLGFERASAALEAAAWLAAQAGDRLAAPMNLKFLSGAHLEHVRRVWADEDAKPWRREPGELSSGAGMPWTRIAGPEDLGARAAAESHAAAYLFVDFLDQGAARRFAAALPTVPGRPAVLSAESVRFAAERFRPMQTKRLGPGLLAAEVVMPATEVSKFLPRAERLAHRAGVHLDAEVYYLADGTALVIGAYLTDHRRGTFAADLMVAPALTDLAMRDHRGRPYVFGRWQAAWTARGLGAARAGRLRGLKHALDPERLVNRGVLTELRLHGVLGGLVSATFAPGVRLVRGAMGVPGAAAGARALLGLLAGPAHGRGAPLPAVAQRGAHDPGAEDRALHCVNCGECNSVCPIFAESKIRLPQMLTHFGEAMRGGAALPESAAVLLDLCMRCGNCEEVCQAGIPHLPLYGAMQNASDAARPAPAARARQRARHVAILAALRASSRYLRDFLHVRPGGYLKRSPASLPGLARYLVLRAEAEAGPAATCIHCGACVAVCPTLANHEFEGEDPRSIVTAQERCIGCGTCVEVCPANHLNGGQTLRVVEAPAREWFLAIEELEKGAPV